MKTISIEEAKFRLLLPELFRRLGIPTRIPTRDNQSCPCPWPDRHNNGDQKPSFNFYAGLTRYCCHACGLKGDGPDFLASYLGIPKKEAISKFIRMAGGGAIRNHLAKSDTTSPALQLPIDLRIGSESEWIAAARSRHVAPAAVFLAVHAGVVRFGTVLGEPCWILLDKTKMAAEARRIDGKPFRGGRKVHTIKGSKKCWPIGVIPISQSLDKFEKVLICEGTPDVLAAFHFLHMTSALDAFPIAILGRNNLNIHPDALKLLKNKRVRIFAHTDPDGGGMKAATLWCKQLRNAGAAHVDGFNFSGLFRRDGRPVTDLNDCTVISKEHEPMLETLLP